MPDDALSRDVLEARVAVTLRHVEAFASSDYAEHKAAVIDAMFAAGDLEGVVYELGSLVVMFGPPGTTPDLRPAAPRLAAALAAVEADPAPFGVEDLEAFRAEITEFADYCGRVERRHRRMEAWHERRHVHRVALPARRTCARARGRRARAGSAARSSARSGDGGSGEPGEGELAAALAGVAV